MIRLSNYNVITVSITLKRDS